jgi:hypothetical protein
MFKADALYIGYPRSGSTYLRAYFKAHPQLACDDQQVAELLYQPSFKPDLIEKPNGKTYVSCDESICESVCVTGRPETWGKYLYHPGCFNLVRHDMVIDPNEAARRVKAVHPNAKILVVIREQADWLSSVYKATISSLPPTQRTFHDYWITPHGIAVRLAGHHDRLLRAWLKLYDDVLVIRYEKLMLPATSWSLCRWLGIDHVPFAPRRINESHAGLSRLHQRLPFLSGLPHGVKAALKPLAKFIPGKHEAVLSDEDAKMIRETYQASNQRTEELLDDLATVNLA